jgi:homocitrate synthase NifV
MVHLLDTTLREGEQTVGIHFTIEQKKKIIDGLARIGVFELEIGVASPMARDLTDITAYCRRNHTRLRTSLWCRCKDEDIHYAATLAPDCLSLSIPVSDLHLTKKLRKNRDWAADALRSAILLARTKGLQVAVGFEDATRAEPAFLLHMASLALHAGAFRIRIADTVGISSPARLASLIKDLKKSLGNCEIGVHTHNDFGMATANAVAALESGAHCADVTILGLGERTGCARLEEVAGYLGIMGSCSQLKVEHLKPLSLYVSEITGKYIDDCRPLLGEKIFTCETGIHLHGLQIDHSTYEPFPPERIGASRHLVFGAKCGKKALGKRLAELGHEIDDDLLLKKIRPFRDNALFHRRTLDDKEFFSTILSL